MKEERKKTLTSAFCSLFKEFIHSLSQVRPGDNSLKFLENAVNGAILLNPGLIVEQFMYCVEGYEDKILERDEDFFLHSLEKDINVSPKDSYIFEEINKVKSIWTDPETSKETKENIWKYLQSFVKLGRSIRNCS